jgi:hypothetical protein
MCYVSRGTIQLRIPKGVLGGFKYTFSYIAFEMILQGFSLE